LVAAAILWLGNRSIGAALLEQALG
jgi:hypothetical protein